MFAPSLSRPTVLVLGAASLAFASGAFADKPCQGPGAPSNTQTKCLTAVQIPGNPLRSFDISWVNPTRAEYYLGDRSNAGVDVIDTEHLTFKRRLGGFVGVALNPDGTVDNSHSGPDGVVTHGRWLYAGDGNSTLRIYDLDRPTASSFQNAISTGGTTRVDEMALTSDGEILLTANNAEDPPYGNLFLANGDRPFDSTAIKGKVTIDTAIVPAGFGLSIEQPAWEPRTGRFYVSVPVIANNPSGCNYGQVPGPDPAHPAPITCDGGLLVVDPSATGNVVYGTWDAATNTGVIALHGCGPNGATVGPHANVLLGCTQANNPSDKITLVINAITHNYASIANIVGSDEVWFNKGDDRYYTGSNRQPGGAVLGVIDGTSVLIETVKQSSGSHSVAADSKRNLIFVPQVAPKSVVGAGGDTTGVGGTAVGSVGVGICGSTNGCVGVYVHEVKDRDRDDDHGDRD